MEFATKIQSLYFYIKQSIFSSNTEPTGMRIVGCAKFEVTLSMFLTKLERDIYTVCTYILHMVSKVLYTHMADEH